MSKWNTKHRFMRVDLPHSTLLVIIVQSTLVVVSYFGAVALRQDLRLAPVPLDSVVAALPVLIAVRVGVMGAFRLH